MNKRQAEKRNSGGLGIFLRNNIKDCVDIMDGNTDVISWLRLYASFFGLNHDVYVTNIYIVPEGSSYHDKETFCLLYDQLSKILRTQILFYAVIITPALVQSPRLMQISGMVETVDWTG